MATKRQVFYSFHYEADYWRTQQVRNMGELDGSKPVSDNDWESIKGRGNRAIEMWIDRQLQRRSCTIVLIGSNTANREWINYEIEESWDKGKGVVGIYIHGLKGSDGKTSAIGRNPFDHVTDNTTGKKLSGIVQCYDPDGRNSEEKYAWISKYLATAVEEAIEIRDKN